MHLIVLWYRMVFEFTKVSTSLFVEPACEQPSYLQLKGTVDYEINMHRLWLGYQTQWKKGPKSEQSKSYVKQDV